MMNEEDFFSSNITEQAKTAIDEADIILFVIDFKEGVDLSDKKIIRALRSSMKTKPMFLLVNKVDNDKRLEEAKNLNLERKIFFCYYYFFNFLNFLFFIFYFLFFIYIYIFFFLFFFF